MSNKNDLYDTKIPTIIKTARKQGTSLLVGLWILVGMSILLSADANAAELNVVYYAVSKHGDPKFTAEEMAVLEEADHIRENSPNLYEFAYAEYDDYYNPEINHREYNETNETLSLEYFPGEGTHGWTVGCYRDSYYTSACYVGGIYMPLKLKFISFGVMYGVIKSPNYNDGVAIPMVFPEIKLHIPVTEHVTIGTNILYLPNVTSDSTWVIGSQFYVGYEW